MNPGWPREAQVVAWIRFHHTDVRNAARALNGGRLLSRARATAGGGIPVDSASPEVISHTREWVKNYVRLYFRPRTPTQYRWEGIRPEGQLYHGAAHCPVPIYFLFDSDEVCTMPQCSFSNGNLGSEGADLGSSAEFLANLDFHKIYSVGSHDPNDRSIPYGRCAEVVVEDQLGFKGLLLIATRSAAERETLISLLSPPGLRQWESKILIDTRLDLYERKWTFIERADLSTDKATLHFSPDTQSPGPFSFRVEVHDLATGQGYEYAEDNFYSTPEWSLTIPGDVWSYRINVTLDSNLAYQSDYFQDLPF